MSHNPFPGPQPYRAEDRERFYARGPLVKKLSNQILACSFTTLYGPSGAGKSSLMQAGVIPALQASKDVRVVRVDAWPSKEPLLPWLVNQIFIDFDLEETSPDDDLQKRLHEAIDLAARRSDRPMLIYLDQLEQIFSSERAPSELGALRLGLAWLHEHAPGDVHVVLSLREDYLGRLRDFTRERPELSAHGFRVAPLSVKEMVEAMCKTATQGDPPQTWGDAEIRRLMLDVRVPGQSETDAAEVQTAFGQIVCRALFEERAAGQTATAQRVNAEVILQRYLDTTLAGLGPLQYLAHKLLEDHLIDDEGHRRLLTEKEARLLMKEPQVVEVLDKLDATRVLRAEEHQGSRYFEIGHDWLAKKLLERRRVRQEWARLAEEKRRRRALITYTIAALMTIIVFLVLTALAWDRTHEAQRAKDDALEAKKNAVRATQMAAVRELLASDKAHVAAMVLAEVDQPEKARGWRKLTMDLLANGLPFRTLRFDAHVTAMTWSPDKQRIATGFKDGTIRVWKVDLSTPPVVLKAHTETIYGIAWSPDGTRLVSGSNDKTARVWNADGSGKSSVLAGHEDWIYSVAWSPDGKRIVTTSFEKNARVWDADGFAQLFVLKDHAGNIPSAAWSPDSKRIVTASQDRTARVWNADGSGKSIVLAGHEDSVRSAAWSPDGTHIITASSDKTARIWNADGSGTPIVFKQYDSGVISAAWSPDGKRIVTTSFDKTAHVWNGDGSGVPNILKGHENYVKDAAWSSDEKQVFTTSEDHTARIWNVGKLAGIRRLKGHEGPIHSAAWSPDGQRFATASRDGTARVWNAESLDELNVFRNHHHLVNTIAWSPNGKRIITASAITTYLWSLDDSDKPILVKDGSLWVNSAAWSPDGNHFAIASDDKTAQIWNLNGSNAPIILAGHEGKVYSVAWSPDGQRIATASGDKTARIWNADGSGAVISFQGHDEPLTSVAWSPDGRRIVTASGDETARIWNADGSGTALILRGHERKVNSAVFHPGGKWIVTTSRDQTARIWASDDSSEPIVLRGHSDFVTAASFSPDGKRILTASHDGTAIVWLFDYALLQEALRNVTSDCLTKTERETYLLESQQDAQSRYEACEKKNGRTPKL